MHPFHKLIKNPQTNEARLLVAAIGILTVTVHTDKTPEDVYDLLVAKAADFGCGVMAHVDGVEVEPGF